MKQMEGKVVSTKQKNTIVVEVVHLSRHPLYKKTVKRTRKFAAHIEGAEIVVGDLVRIEETKPISKTKHFRFVGKVAR